MSLASLFPALTAILISTMVLTTPSVRAEEPPIVLNLDMESVSGRDVKDAGPAQVQAKATNADLATGPGKLGQAIHFTGNKPNPVRVQGGLIEKIGSPFTLSFWIKPDRFPPKGFTAAVVGKREEFWQEKPFVVLLADDGALLVEASNGSENANAALQKLVPLNEWTHIAVTHAADGERVIYVNGEEKSREKLPGTLAMNDQAIYLGYEKGVDRDFCRKAPFEGWIDEVRIYAAALTPAQIQQAGLGKLAARAAKAEDFAKPVFAGELLLTRFDRPVGFAKREALSREKAYRREGPDAVDWIPMTIGGKKYFESNAQEKITLPLRVPPENMPLFQQNYDSVLEPANIWFRAVQWIWGRRYLYTIEPTTRSDSKKMEIWTFPVKIASDTGEKLSHVTVEAGGQMVYDRKEDLNSLTLLLPRSAKGKPYRVSVNGSAPVEFAVGLEPIEPGNPQEIPLKVDQAIAGTSFTVKNLAHPEEIVNKQDWRQDLVKTKKEGPDLMKGAASVAAPPPGFRRYLGLEVPRSPIAIHNVNMSHGMSGGHFWLSAQGPDALHAANTAFKVIGGVEDYAAHLEHLGIDQMIERAGDEEMSDRSSDRRVEDLINALTRHGIRAGLNVISLSDSNLPFYAWNLPDYWLPKLRDVQLVAQRFARFPNFTTLTYLGDNAGYVPYWDWAPPIPNRPWAEAMSIYMGTDRPEVPIGPGLPVVKDYERPGTQKEFIDYLHLYDRTFARLGDFGEAARQIKPELQTSTQSFGSSPGVGGSGGWPWATMPGREMFSKLTALQTYDWDETYAAKPLHNVALMDRLRSYYPDKPAWALLDYFYLKFGKETLRRAYAIALTRGIDAVGVNWISLPKGQYARPQKVEQDREVNLWAKRLGGAYGGTEPEPSVGVMFVNEQALSRKIAEGRDVRENLLSGSQEGKSTEALFFSHAAGWPAKIITVDEVKRGLPPSMKAILLVGLNKFDDTWAWYDGIEDELQKFVAAGGRVIADKESVAPVETIKTDMEVLAYTKQGAGGTKRPSMDVTPVLIERNMKNIEMLRTAMEGVPHPVAFSTEPTIWAIPHRTGTTGYVTVVNQGSLPNKNATEFFKPQTGKLEWNTKGPIFDVTAGKRVSATEPVDLQETAVRVYALPAAEPGMPVVKVAKGQDGFYAATVQTGPNISGTPVELTLKNDQDSVVIYGATGSAIRLPLTDNEPGTYQVAVTDLLTGKQASSAITVAGGEAPAPAPESNTKRLEAFAKRADVPLTIALTREQKQDPAMMEQVERIQALLQKAGRSATVRDLEPFEVVEHLQTYHAGQRYPQWSTIPEDLILLGTPATNVLIFDQARGQVLPPFEEGSTALVVSAFRPGFNALTLLGSDAPAVGQAIDKLQQSLNL